MKTKKLGKFVNYVITLKQKKDIVDLVTKAKEDYEKNRERYTQIFDTLDRDVSYTSSYNTIPLDIRNDIEELMKKYFYYVTMTDVHNLYRIAANTVSSNRTILKRAKDVMEFINEPTYDGLLKLDVFEYDPSLNISYIGSYKPSVSIFYKPSKVRMIGFSRQNELEQLFVAKNMNNLIFDSFNNSSKELMKYIFSDDRHVEIRDMIDKYIDDDKIHIDQLLNLLNQIKLSNKIFISTAHVSIDKSTVRMLDTIFLGDMFEDIKDEKDKDIIISLIHLFIETSKKKMVRYIYDSKFSDIVKEVEIAGDIPKFLNENEFGVESMHNIKRHKIKANKDLILDIISHEFTELEDYPYPSPYDEDDDEE